MERSAEFIIKNMFQMILKIRLRVYRTKPVKIIPGEIPGFWLAMLGYVHPDIAVNIKPKRQDRHILDRLDIFGFVHAVSLLEWPRFFSFVDVLVLQQNDIGI